MTTELENYEPKGQLEGFPKEIISRMLDCQEKQCNPRNVSIFERNKYIILEQGGFDWDKTIEKDIFWNEVISYKNFNLFFEKYPKKEDNQEFRVGDKIYDILLKEVGIVQDIVYSSSIPYGLSVEFKSGVKSYTINGCYIPEYKNPHVLHYRDDYNYDVIDFNNLPKRQEPKRWRAEVGEFYYTITTPAFKIRNVFDIYVDSDNENFEIGNYFQTEEQAQKVAFKLKEYFKQLI